MFLTITDDRIIVEVNEGCVSCPFATENFCGCDKEVVSSHDYSYPVKCPLLKKVVEVRRFS